VGTARAAWEREWRDASLGLLSAQDDHMRYAAGAVLRLAVVLAVFRLRGSIDLDAPSAPAAGPADPGDPR